MAYPRIDIAFCVNDRYAEYVGVTLWSILDSHGNVDVVIHILSDYISDRRKATLLEIVAPFPDVNLRFYSVDDTVLRGLKDTWSIYTWYRVLLPDLLPDDVRRVLYLDTDTLVTGDLTELFTMDMTDRAVACAIDIMSFDDEAFERCGFPREKVYVCAGVMMLNLDFWRENALAEKIVRYGRENDARIRFPDQDTINILCQDTKIVLPMKFGIQEAFFRNDILYGSRWSTEMLECIDDPRIVHYAGYAPWVREYDWTVMHHRWMNVSRSLPHPVRPRYRTRGLNLLKVWAYSLFHHDYRRDLTESEVRRKIIETRK
ncbi:MAG: glycosyltransferase family 8 protein [Muribaculaceae bacterium]|nr:glycosyltransferase family 8 protein [Muribaculaceae bacterium]